MNFPDNFLFGTSVSHFQVEGIHSEFERGLSDWAMWCKQADKIRNNEYPYPGSNFKQKYLDDLEIAQKLNLKAFRFSINWAYLCPNAPKNLACEPELNIEAVEYYKNLLATIKQKGMVSFVTLFHFTLPSYIFEVGGWSNDITVTQFGHFAKLVGEVFKDDIDFIITVNEPMVYVYHSFISGKWPPGYVNSYDLAFIAMKNLLKAHALAYNNLKQIKNFTISFSKHWRLFKPSNFLNPLDHYVCSLRDEVFNKCFMRALSTGYLKFPKEICINKTIGNLQGYIPDLKDTLDYIGINYYTSDDCAFSSKPPFNIFGDIILKPHHKVNCLGWKICPDSLYEILTREITPFTKDSKGQKLPIYITENGYPEIESANHTLEDTQRCKYIIDHLKAVYKAIKQGCDIRGYIYWSLIDNFEWDLGFEPRFGLLKVNYSDSSREIRYSARVLAEIARSNMIHHSLSEIPLILPKSLLNRKFS